jgi:hypothetical protein
VVNAIRADDLARADQPVADRAAADRPVVDTAVAVDPAVAVVLLAAVGADDPTEDGLADVQVV